MLMDRNYFYNKIKGKCNKLQVVVGVVRRDGYGHGIT